MEVEVVFPKVCGAFYKATIMNINMEDSKALLSFENNWKSDMWVELEHVRYPPPLTLDSSIEPGSNVEALLPHQDNEPPGWWNGTLLKSKGPLHVVEFQSGSDKYQDIVEQDKIRQPNTNKPLSTFTLLPKTFPVPHDLQDYCTKQSVHENFRKRVNALLVHYDTDKRTLVVLAESEQCLDKASLLIEIHLRDLRTRKQILTRTEIVAQMQQQRQLESGVYEQQISIPSDLVGLAIGKDGSNVNEVRRLPGILSVEFDDYMTMFRVRAKTPECLTRAKELLEFTRDTVLIPKNLAGKVIGKKGHLIQEILRKSKVHRVRVLGDDDECRERNIDLSVQVPFDFVGRKTAVDNAKLMLEYHLDQVKDMESLLQDAPPSPSEELPNYYPAPGRPRTFYSGRRGQGREYGSRGWGGRGGGGEERGGGGGEERGGGGRKPYQNSHSSDHQEDWGQSPRGKEEEGEMYYSNDESVSEEEKEEREKREEEEEDEVEVEKEGRREEAEQSPPESDEQGPDRRRQYDPRGGRGGRGGGRGGYYRWRGRGGRGRGWWGGRGRGRGYGYRSNRPPRTGPRDNWDGPNGRSEDTASGGGHAPKPLREGHGRQREQQQGSDTPTSQAGQTSHPHNNTLSHSVEQ